MTVQNDILANIGSNTSLTNFGGGGKNFNNVNNVEVVLLYKYGFYGISFCLYVGYVCMYGMYVGYACMYVCMYVCM